MPRSSRRRSIPISPAKVATESTSSQVRRSTRTQNHQSTSSAVEEPQKSLEPVHEEQDTISVHDKNAENGRDLQELEEEADDESDDYSEWADEDFTDLDKDLILDNLNAINVDVNDIFRLINSYPSLELFRDVQNPLSSTTRRLRHLSQRLIHNLEPCGKEILIQASRLSQFVTDGNDSNEVEKIFIKANLALTVVKLLQGRWHEQEKSLDDFLSFIAEIKTFPSPFLQQRTPDHVHKFPKAFKVSTIEVGVSILTQWLIRSEENQLTQPTQHRVDPELLVLSVFFEDDHEQFRDISLDSSSPSTRDAVGVIINQRIAEIQKYFTQDNSASINIDEIIERFPVQDLISDTIAWATERKGQLDQSIMKQGGVEVISNNLWKQQSTPDAKKGKQKRKSRKSRESMGLEAGAVFCANLDGYLNETTPQEEEISQIESPLAARNADEIAETPQPDEPVIGPPQPDEVDLGNVNIMNDDGQSDRDIPPSAQPLRDITQDMLDGGDNIRAAANKENVPQQRLRLTERQPNAVREQWDSPEPPSRNTGKRTQRPRESDDEDEFETDTRQQKRPRMENNRVNRPAPSIILESDGIEENPRSSQNRPPSATPIPRNRPSATQPSSSRLLSQSPPPGSFEAYQVIKQRAKENMHITTALLPPSSNTSINLQSGYPSHQTSHGRAQVRRAWTPGEIERLWKMIAEYGTQWSKMLKVDAEISPPMLQNRTQVQLKDKARNIKLDLLKAQMPLPPGFEGVTVSRAQKDVLRGLGIPVEEEDVGLDDG